jgi:hypothetical protein
MSDLTEFLLARIAEDENWAKDASPWATGSRNEGKPLDWQRHMWNWSPARVLAECEAKRGAIEAAWGDHLRMEGEWGDCRGQEQLSASNDYPLVVQLLALPYADRPGFPEEWRT